ncbi:RWD domain-containing protein 3 [Cololabis saira]|uniref:RWD domain-containing protein 3 n=1 Tax=Cololabis saira TaxID=129043 RepID=UPI002AD2B77D|nr:RWD domain-containing protein 3 [Cololabis saira]
MMSEAALEEVSVLSSIYCGEGEFHFRQSDQDGLVVQINCSAGAGRGLVLSVVFRLQPDYPAHPPHISVSSTDLSRAQCDGVRQKLQARAAALPPEPMVHQLVQYLQEECVQLSQDPGADTRGTQEREPEEEWTAVLLLDHIRSQNRYVALLERWSVQLQLAGRLLLGPKILLLLQGCRRDVKEFCRRLKTVKVDVDSTGKKCKERMMTVLLEAPSSSGRQGSQQGFSVQSYQSPAELAGSFQELSVSELYQQILPTLRA